jgi:hypothetical protein
VRELVSSVAPPAHALADMYKQVLLNT